MSQTGSYLLTPRNTILVGWIAVLYPWVPRVHLTQDPGTASPGPIIGCISYYGLQVHPLLQLMFLSVF